jgi:DNA-binding transcriptional MerR regulator
MTMREEAVSMRGRDGRSRHGRTAWATRALRRHGMPSEEIRAVVAADDPEIVRRYLELHRERLDERVEEQRRTLAVLERVLTDSIARN